MELEEYVEYIERYEIPPTPPIIGDLEIGNVSMFEARHACTRRGCWVVIADSWLKPLAEWMGDRIVLEIMAGGGWIAKGLENHGTEVWATDDYSWDGIQHSEIKHLTAVAEVEAYVAIADSPSAQILLVSWPPYGEHDIVKACKLWGEERPIVYIGEDQGGCNAPDEFFEHFAMDDNAPNINLPQWWGLHDDITIGNWSNERIYEYED